MVTVRVADSILGKYRGLADIPDEEWSDFFPKLGKSWTTEDLEYLREWWGKDDILSLAYALGRPPWGLQREISKMRKRGIHIDYQRSDFSYDDERELVAHKA